jgi:glutamate-ammonia-ligase adenylyltransferase
MPSDKEIQENITEVSRLTTDPKRAEANLCRLFETASERERLIPHILEIAKLFAISQFLANYCISNPKELISVLKEIREPVTKKLLSARSSTEPALHEAVDISDIMKSVRLFKKRYLLSITLRDIMRITDMLTCMDELTCLAEIIINLALQRSMRINFMKFGEPSEGRLTLIALGKLGGEELNYSSDVDLMAVYGDEEGQTSGIINPSGIRVNRISNGEFYAKVMELFNTMLSRNTEDGIAYRVDLRLRPQGQKGEIALPLNAYKNYYETWGQTWERMALIRARPVAGDSMLGRMFMEAIEPFVWKKSADYLDIEEIKALKKKIDSSFSKDDLKRGYGGIREAEFFIQTFQLIYGHAHEGLRTHRLLNAIQSLRWIGLVPGKDLITLWDNYLYLRRVEHFLQMKDDLQTHSLPKSEDDLKALAEKTGFSSINDFLSDLRLKRMETRNMYNSLLGTEEDVHAQALTLLEGDLSDDECAGYLSFRGLKMPLSGVKNLKSIREQFSLFRTQHERNIMRKAIPMLIEKTFNAESPDRAFSGLESFFTATGIKETYLTGLTERKELADGIIKIFSLSPYLTRVFLSNTIYLDLLLEGNIIRKTFRKTRQELYRNISQGHCETKIAEYKNVEEIRLGSFFLMHVIRGHYLVKCLSHLADAIIWMITSAVGANGRSPVHNQQLGGLSVLGMGKLGGREITFGSDLDIIFLSENPGDLKTAEKVLRTLTAYTDKGIIYRIDTRLRPDGTRGALLKDIEGYRNYYFHNAHLWEIQALLKVRPVAGDMNLGKLFMEMAREAVIKRGAELKKDDVAAMRERIMKELSLESEGIDIKLGPGGIEEIEFYIQWLQLHHAREVPEILVQDTIAAAGRLAKKGILGFNDAETLLSSYKYLRTLETFMRLNEEHVIAEDSGVTELAAIFMGHKDKEEFLEHLRNLRKKVLEVLQ